LDREDAILRDSIDIPVLVTNTVMTDLDSKTILGRETLAFGALLASGAPMQRAMLDRNASPSP